MQNSKEYGGTDQSEEIGGEEGAAQQFKQILASGLPPLYRVAYRILGNAADAEDALQDALLAAYTHLDHFRGQAQISTWLTTIVPNCARLSVTPAAKAYPRVYRESSEELQAVSVSERLADRRPNPEDHARSSGSLRG